MAQETASEQTSRRARRDYPEDRFDRVQRAKRVGAHRINPRPRYLRQYLIAIVLGSALLTVGGVLWLTSRPGAAGLAVIENQTQSHEDYVAAKLDPQATVVVLDGTEYEGALGAAVDKVITAEGLGQIVSSGPADNFDVEISGVFYWNPADEAAAKGLAEKLGGVTAYFNEEYKSLGGQLIVLLGADYAGPGRDSVLATPPPVNEQPSADTSDTSDTGTDTSDTGTDAQSDEESGDGTDG